MRFVSILSKFITDKQKQFDEVKTDNILLAQSQKKVKTKQTKKINNNGKALKISLFLGVISP